MIEAIEPGFSLSPGVVRGPTVCESAQIVSVGTGGCVYPIAVSEVPASDSLDLALVLPRTVHLDGDTSLTLIYRTMPQV